MSKEISFEYKDLVANEAEQIAGRLGVALSPRAIRFPRMFVPDEENGSKKRSLRDILIVDPVKISELSPARRFKARNYFAVNLLASLGYISGKEDIAKVMEGADGNLFASFDHKKLPYKAQALIQNTGCGEYLLNGFVISPK